MKKVIRVGDPTSHGGKVETGASDFEVDGLPVACVGDRCFCPQQGHENREWSNKKGAAAAAPEPT